MIKQITVITAAYHFCQLHKKFYPPSYCQGLTPYAEEIIGDNQRVFRRNTSATNHIFCIPKILEKKWEYNEAVYQLVIGFKKACDSVRREVWYNILIEFGIPMKLVRLI